MLLKKLEELHNRREERRMLMANKQSERATQEAVSREDVSSQLPLYASQAATTRL